MVHRYTVKTLILSTLLKSAGAGKGGGVGIGAAELPVEGHGLFGAASFKEGGTERGRCGRVEDAVGHELLPGVVSKDLAPKVAVVACAVSAVEDVVEVGGAVTRDDFIYQSHLLAHLFLKGADVLRAGEFGQLGRSELVPLHVQDGSCAEFPAHEALIEPEPAANLGNEFGRDGLSGAVIICIRGKDFRDEGEVLVELGEGLHEVTGDAGAGNSLVIALSQETVKGVAEFMEGRLHIVY